MLGHRILLSIVILLSSFFLPVFVSDSTAGWGEFVDSAQSLGNSENFAVALGDFNGDGDLDAFVANWGQPNTVWINNGPGTFSDSGQSLGSSPSLGVALGDLDGDGDLGAFVANASFSAANKVWENNGTGNFIDTGQELGSSPSQGVTLGDVDGDGDVDAFVANYRQANKVWQNEGTGNFGSVHDLGNSDSRSVALGDLDNDGDLDAFVANDGNNKVWIFNFCLCDIEEDGDVHEQDLAVFADEYGRSNCESN